MIDITAIIPVYNRAQKVKKAVRSVLEQTFSPSEIIVVDDGSSDNLAAGIEEFKDERLKIVKQLHQGVAAARNTGIKESKTDWLAFLDSDDSWLSAKLEKQVNYHEQNPETLVSQTDEIWIRNGKQVNPRNYHLKPEGRIFAPSLSRCLVSPSAVMINRRVLQDVGLFDSDLPACEDYDLWLRISSKYKIGLVEEKLVIKTGGHPDQLSRKYWGMDRFRVKALEKLIENHPLSELHKKLAIEKLMEKLLILKNGAKKRGKVTDVKTYNKLLKKYFKILNEFSEEAQVSEL